MCFIVVHGPGFESVTVKQPAATLLFEFISTVGFFSCLLLFFFFNRIMVFIAVTLWDYFVLDISYGKRYKHVVGNGEFSSSTGKRSDTRTTDQVQNMSFGMSGEMNMLLQKKNYPGRM